jgi:hypothetical protein
MDENISTNCRSQYITYLPDGIFSMGRYRRDKTPTVCLQQGHWGNNKEYLPDICAQAAQQVLVIRMICCFFAGTINPILNNPKTLLIQFTCQVDRDLIRSNYRPVGPTQQLRSEAVGKLYRPIIGAGQTKIGPKVHTSGAGSLLSVDTIKVMWSWTQAAAPLAPMPARALTVLHCAQCAVTRSTVRAPVRACSELCHRHCAGTAPIGTDAGVGSNPAVLAR